LTVLFFRWSKGKTKKKSKSKTKSKSDTDENCLNSHCMPGGQHITFQTVAGRTSAVVQAEQKRGQRKVPVLELMV
jgi:hypothetical protein